MVWTTKLCVMLLCWSCTRAAVVNQNHSWEAHTTETEIKENSKRNRRAFGSAAKILYSNLLDPYLPQLTAKVARSLEFLCDKAIQMPHSPKNTAVFVKMGDTKRAITDFSRLNPVDVKYFQGQHGMSGLYGYIDDYTLTFRNFATSSPDTPTVEMFKTGAKKQDRLNFKFRYSPNPLEYKKKNIKIKE